MKALRREQSPGLAKSNGSRVAFFGGSFDPPHLGHLAVARAARTAFHLDTVLFAPVGAQPLKPEGHTASFEDRVAMTELATAGEPGFAISLADAPRPDGRPNFTLETLEEVRAQLGSRCTLFCLMGADSYFGLTDWYRAPEIPFAATLIVASRPGEPLDAMQKAIPHGLTLTASADTNKSEGGVRFCEYAITNTAGEKALFYVLPDLDVPASATEIRRQIQQDSDGLQKSSPAALLPQAVAEYICTHHLYR